MGAQISSQEAEAHDPDFSRVGWVKVSPERGTLDLLVTCLATLLLCVYSSLHPNLPMQLESNIQRQWRYFKWGLLGILGPELIVWTAWRQHVSARALQAEVEKQDFSRLHRKGTGLSTKSRHEEPGPLHKWTVMHGFYAGMGGFVIDLEDLKTDDETPFIPGERYLTLTPRGVKLLAECGLLPDISSKEISERSKTDGLGKALAILQASWLLVQVINRLIARLPVTLLEINTLGHVGCALGIYLLWWRKPGWLNYPTKLHGDWVRPVAAFMYMSSHLSGRGNNWQTFLRDFGGQPEISRLAYVATEEEERPPRVPPKDFEQTDDESHEAKRSSTSSDTFKECGKGHFVPLPEEAMPQLLGSKTNTNTTTRTDSNHDPEKGTVATEAQLEDTDSMRSLRWQLASTAIHLYPSIAARMIPHTDIATKKYRDALRHYPEIPARFKRRIQPLILPYNVESQRQLAQPQYLECETEELVVTYAGNWPSDELLRGVPGVIMGMTLWFASVGYGAVHLTAWRDDDAFPTRIEAHMWRISAVYIAGSGLLWMGINLLAHMSELVWWFWYDILAGQVSRRAKGTLGVLGGTGGLCYIFARTFIVVEAFLSLRSQPKEAYVETGWSMVFPHL